MTRQELKAARTEAHLTQAELARVLGVSEGTVARLESGRMAIDARWSSHLGFYFAYRGMERAVDEVCG